LDYVAFLLLPLCVCGKLKINGLHIGQEILQVIIY